MEDAAPHFDLVLGPLATVGLVSLVWAAKKRSRRALTLGVAALAAETQWEAYRRVKTDPRFQIFNLVMVVRRDSGPLRLI